MCVRQWLWYTLLSCSVLLLCLGQQCLPPSPATDDTNPSSTGNDGDQPDGTGPVSGQVYYVSPQGDDNAAGTSEITAFRTITHAVASAAPGTTVLVLPGTYNESLQLSAVGGSAGPVTLRGENGRPVLDGQRTRSLGFWCDDCTNIVIENLEVRNYSDIGVGFLNSSGITLRNLVVHHNGFAAQLADWDIEGYGIVADTCQNVTIENNDVYENGPNPQQLDRWLGTGIDTFGCRDMTIRNNHSHHNIGGGVLVEDSVNVLFEGNEIDHNDLDATVEGWWDGGLWLDGGRDVTVRNNTFHDHLGPALQISDEEIRNPTGYVIENNTITNNTYGLYIWNFGTSQLPAENILKLSNNQITGSTVQDIWIVPWGCPPEDQPCE